MPRRRSEWEVAHRRRLLAQLARLARAEPELGLDTAMERLGLSPEEREPLYDWLRRRGLRFQQPL